MKIILRENHHILLQWWNWFIDSLFNLNLKCLNIWAFFFLEGDNVRAILAYNSSLNQNTGLLAFGSVNIHAMTNRKLWYDTSLQKGVNWKSHIFDVHYISRDSLARFAKLITWCLIINISVGLDGEVYHLSSKVSWCA